MATILVDYENVCGSNGLAGAEYLTRNDDLCIFFSKVCPNISLEDSERIEKSGCEFRLCELKVPRKNALDFYIATEAGAVSAAGEERIIIVSKDAGFNSVRDYFQVKEAGLQIVVAKTVEEGLKQLSGPEDNERKKQIHDRSAKANLMAECARINERKAMKESIAACLEGTEYEGLMNRVLSCVDRVGTTSKKDLYHGSLHEFGREYGTKIYNMLKQVV